MTLSRPCDITQLDTDVVVIGSGLAGLSAALAATPRNVQLLTFGTLGEPSASFWAKGGIAAAVGDDDSPELHLADTLRSGAGLVDRRMAQLLVQAADRAISLLATAGAHFDREPDGTLTRGLEGGHQRRRILHAAGDESGKEFVRALRATVRQHSSITVFENTEALSLVRNSEGRVVGVLAARHGSFYVHRASAVILATGGIGQLFGCTTNPESATGSGIALAAEAGATLADLEFVQFHPTALRAAVQPLPLLTEALRGAGASVIDDRGVRFLTEMVAGGELACRDAVSRSIWQRLREGHEIFLDARERPGASFPDRFPSAFAACRTAGLDPRRELIPITPAAHYHMGGVLTDSTGRTSLPGLWAAGEVASTGVHGANRLASNSLLEAVVFGTRAGVDARDTRTASAGFREQPVLHLDTIPTSTCGSVLETELTQLMWRHAGIVRNAAGLTHLVTWIETARAQLPPGAAAGRILITAELIARSALFRTESRGAHYREDFPAEDPRFAERTLIRYRGPESLPEITLAGANRTQTEEMQYHD